jgi:hypothetical protein
MGLLEDAIREHLELKRRHGADPDEVARQANEALGSPRHGQFAQPEGEGQPEPPEPPQPPFEEPGEAPAAIAASATPPSSAEEPAAEDEPWLPDEPDEVPASETLEHPVLDAAEGEPGGEDVLQETPEFLQETPEHDRLWFEQKPPRNFDWDK